MKNLIKKLYNPIIVIFGAIILSIPAFVNSIMVDAEGWSDLSWWGFISAMAIPLALLWLLILLFKGFFKKR